MNRKYLPNKLSDAFMAALMLQTTEREEQEALASADFDKHELDDMFADDERDQ